MSAELLKGVKVSGCGMWVPENTVTNIQLIEKYGLPSSDEWVREHTGITERRINDNPGIATSDMAAEAARAALLDAGIEPGEVGGVLVATATPDHQLGGTAPAVKEKLGIKQAFAVDINAGCSGFVYAHSLAEALVKLGRYKHVLTIGADMFSTIMNWQDRNTCFLFGDGAGALVLSAGERSLTPMTSYLDADGSNPSLLCTPSGGSREVLTVDKLLAQDHKIRMNGRAIFERAVEEMSASIDRILEITGLAKTNIDWIVPHQANLLIIDTLRDWQDLQPAKVLTNIQRYGNTSAASIPLVLTEADRAGQIKPGDSILEVAFGAGLTWGAVHFIWKENSLPARHLRERT